LLHDDARTITAIIKKDNSFFMYVDLAFLECNV
jgi:hypothetical protein